MPTPSTILDGSIWLAASGGTGSFVETTAAIGYQTMEAAGALDGQQFSYRAQSSDNSQWEIGTGIWTASTKTLTRVVLFNSLGTTAAINFISPPQILITALASDIVAGPGGSNTQVQFNSSGAFGGDAGFTYAGSGQATLALGTISANVKALSITGTWNNAGTLFDAPLSMNITTSAYANFSNLLNFTTSSGAFRINAPTASALDMYQYSSGTTAGMGFSLQNTSSGGAFFFEIGGSGSSWGGLLIYDANVGQRSLVIQGAVGTVTAANMYIGWSSLNFALANSNAEVKLFRDAAAQTLALANGANGMAFRVYNTTDQTATNAAPTNYERAALDWTTNPNTLTLGTQNGGTGSGRDILVAPATGAMRVAIGASVVPVNNGELTFQATSNTSLTFKYKGSDGTVRSASLVLT